MPIFATGNISERPRACTEVYIQERTASGNWRNTEKHYVYNIDYVHQNISDKIGTSGSFVGSSGTYILNDCDNDNKRYILEYESICNPITMSHFYTTDLKDLTRLFQGQVMGQNKGSAFRHICSVAGTYIDKEIVTTVGLFIKRSAPILQLLSRAPMTQLQTTNSLVKILQTTKFPKENELAWKPIYENHYIITSKEEYETQKELVSAYYPVITSEMCKELTENMPRIEIDFACFGLGSAGTGVLDMLGRSVFFDKYLICDFDIVESKNLRNQWYTTTLIGNSKTSASAQLLRYRSYEKREITTIQTKFQDVQFYSYNIKYAMSAFDSIETRLAFLETAMHKDSQIKYLIDARYEDLTASIFFVDLENKEEVEFYQKGLLSDKQAFDKQHETLRIKNFDELHTELKEQHCFLDSCSYCKDKLVEAAYLAEPEKTKDIPLAISCPRSSGRDTQCGSEECLNSFKEFYNEYLTNAALYRKERESSCLRQNFIDIYHYASTFIFDSIRLIEEGRPKPFTQVDVTTDPLPASMMLRR